MSKYTITVSGTSGVVLYENDSPLITCGADGRDFHFVDDITQYDEVTQFTPTWEFYQALVDIEEYTGEMAQQIKFLRVPDEAIPDAKEWGLLHYPTLPKYEERLLIEIQFKLFKCRLNTRTVFEDIPSFRRLFRHAFTEVNGEVPEYLTEHW